VIAHAHLGVAVVPTECDLDGLSLLRVLHRIAKQIDNDGADLRTIGDDRENLGTIEANGVSWRGARHSIRLLAE
jgi:hypothetical protein